METTEIINRIKRLSLQSKMEVLEKTIQSIKEDDLKRTLLIASEKMCDDYSNDKELTAFTNIDFDDFYETK